MQQILVFLHILNFAEKIAHNEFSVQKTLKTLYEYRKAVTNLHGEGSQNLLLQNMSL